MTDEHEARFDNADEQDEESETDTIKVQRHKTRRGQKGRKETPPRKDTPPCKDTPLCKETAEKIRRESNAKKNKRWGDSDESGDEPDQQSSSNKKLVKNFLEKMSTALEAEVQSILSLAPGEELNAESIGFIKQRAQAVIQHQCDTLYDPKQQVHQDICYEIILRTRSVTAKFEEDLNWDQFSFFS